MFPEGTDDLFTFTYKTKHKQSHQHTTAEVFEHFIMTNGLNHHFSLQPCMKFQCTCANAITKLAFSTEK